MCLQLIYLHNGVKAILKLHLILNKPTISKKSLKIWGLNDKITGEIVDVFPIQCDKKMVLAFSYNIWPHCAPSGTQEDDHEHNWRWQDEAAPGPDSPPEVSNYSNFLWYDNFFMCRQTCIITDVGSFLALSNISCTLVDFWMSGWKLAKLKTDHCLDRSNLFSPS